MAANDELIRLILSVSGEDAIATLTDRLNENQASAAALQAAFSAGETATDAYLKAMSGLANEAKSLKSLIASLSDEMANQVVSLGDLTDEIDRSEQAQRDAEQAARDAAEAYRNEVVSLDDLSEELALAEQAERDAAQAAHEAAAAYQILGAETYDLASATDTASEKAGEYAVAEYGVKQAADAAAAAYRAEQADLSGLSDGAKLTKKEVEQLAYAKQAGSTVTNALKASIKALELELKDLRDQARAGAVSLEDFTDKENKLKNSISNQKGLLNSLGSEAGFSASKMLNLGNTIDDLQYVGEMGLRPIVNNIMQLAPKIGVAMIAIEMLRRAFGEQLKDAVGEYLFVSEKAVESTDSLKKKIEELEKKPFKVAVDVADLDKAKAQLDDLERREANRKAASGSTPEKSFAGESQKVVTDYLGGQDNLVNVLTELEKQSGFVHGSATDLDAAKRLRAAIASPTIDARTGVVTSGGEEDKRMLEVIETRIAQAGREYVQKQIVDPFLAGDTKGIQTLQNIAERNPGAFARMGMDGRTGADAIGMMPKSIEELLQRRKETEMHAANTKEAIASSEKQTKENEYIQGLWNETAAKEKADKKAGIKEAERLQEQANKKKAAEAERRRRKQEEAMGFIAKQRQGERAKAQAAALDPDQAALNRLTPQAAAHLNQNGFNRDEATAYAPKLAEALLRGADLNIATQELSMQMLSAINDANQRTARAESMMRAMQLMMMRQRQRRPTNQDFPFN